MNEAAKNDTKEPVGEINREPKKIQCLSTEKLGSLFENLTLNNFRSVVALKADNQPLVHFLSIPHDRADKLCRMLELMDIKVDFVEVTATDFGDLPAVKCDA